MKVCPRCSYVDTEDRRVCMACRGSLMGVAATEAEAAPVAAAPAAPPVAVATVAPPVPRPAPPVVTAPSVLTAPPVVTAPRVATAATVAPIGAVDPPRPSTVRRSSRPRPVRTEPREPRDAPVASHGRRRIVLVAVVLVVALLGVRAVRGALAGDDGALVRDPTTAVERLPWRTEKYGDLAIAVPTAPVPSEVDAASGFGRYDRYVLPDVTLTITSRDAVAGLDTDAALRSYATQAAQLAGGGVATGFARDLTFGTAFSATLQTPDGVGYLYVVSTPTGVVVIRADAASVESGRPTRIFEHVIRSVTPR